MGSQRPPRELRKALPGGLPGQTLAQNSEGKLWDYRCEVKGHISDPGAEQGLPRALFGGRAEVADAIAAMRAGTVAAWEPQARNITLLWNALDQPGSLHILSNAIRESLEQEVQSGLHGAG